MNLETQAVPADHRWALRVFIVLELVSLPLMVWWGSDGWFAIDDWDFLATRQAGSVSDLLRPHYGHWTTLPALAYRALWSVVGLRSYVPYLALSVTAHLAVVALIRAVMRRCGVRPGLATLMSTMLLLFGPGAENILVSFQITFLWALAFGLAQLLLADHPGPPGWRDLAALVAGLAGLMCSGVALAMVIAVGVAILLRRGLPAALLQTLPLVMIYLMWMQLTPSGQSTDPWRPDSPLTVARFVGAGAWASFDRLGGIPGIGLLVVAILIVGAKAAMSSRPLTVTARAAALPLGLFVGAMAFLAMTAATRSGTPALDASFFPPARSGVDRASLSRYVYIVGALMLPGIAYSADALVRRSKPLAVAVFATMTLGLPGNITRLATYEKEGPWPQTKQHLLVVAQLPIATQLPRSLQPEPLRAGGVTVGWLLDTARDRRLPVRDRPSDSAVADATVRVLLRGAPAPPGQVQALTCPTFDNPATLTLEKGDRLTVESGIVDVYVIISGVRSQPAELVRYFSPYDSLAGPVQVLVEPRPGSQWGVEGPSHASNPAVGSCPAGDTPITP